MLIADPGDAAVADNADDAANDDIADVVVKDAGILILDVIMPFFKHVVPINNLG